MRFKLTDLPLNVRREVEAQLGIHHPLPVPTQSIPRALKPLKAPPLPSASSGPKEIKLWLNYMVPSLNRILYRNRFQILKYKAEASAAMNAVYTPALPMFNTKVLVQIEMHRCRLIDIDNAFVKFAIDQLRYYKLLAEDNPEAMSLVVTQKKVPKRYLEGTAITISPV